MQWKNLLRRLQLQNFGGLFKSKKFEKVKGNNIVSVNKKCFSYVIDFKSFGYSVLVFIIVVAIILINSLYSLTLYLKVFKSEFFRISIA